MDADTATALQQVGQALKVITDRLTILEQSVAGSGATPEATVPTYLTINPATGAVGALFTGGVQLNESQGAGPAATNSAITWVRLADGSVVAQVYTYFQDIGGGNSIDTLLSQVKALNATSQSTLDLQAGGQVGSSDVAEITLIRPPSGDGTHTRVVAGAKATADDGGIAHNATVIDSLGQSSFLQNDSVRKRRVVTTAITGLTWPGGTNGVVTAFAHGAIAPTVTASYFAEYQDAAGTTAAFTVIRSPTLTGCNILSVAPLGNPAAATAFNLYVTAVLDG